MRKRKKRRRLHRGHNPFLSGQTHISIDLYWNDTQCDMSLYILNVFSYL